MGDFDYDSWLKDLTSYGSGQMPVSNAIGNAATATAGATNPNGVLGWLQGTGFMGKDGQQGWGGMALGALNGLGSAYMGMKQYGQAQQALQMQKDQFNLNYGAQRSAYNNQLEDRQRARVAASGGQGNIESVDSYMARNRIN